MFMNALTLWINQPKFEQVTIRLAPTAYIMNHFIQLHLFASLKSYIPDPGPSYPIIPGIRVKDILDQLSIPMTEAKLIFVNGAKADLETRLKGGERVGIFPPIGGG